MQMNTEYDPLIQLFKTRLMRLRQQCDTFPKTFTRESVFDTYLFNPAPNLKTTKELLSYYLDQIQNNLTFLSEHNKIRCEEAIIYLINKIADQLLALNRELKTHRLRPKTTVENKETPYDIHCRYLSYERRLVGMKLQTQKQLDAEADPAKRTYWSQQLAAIGERLLRCRNAISHLEKML